MKYDNNKTNNETGEERNNSEEWKMVNKNTEYLIDKTLITIGRSERE